MGSEFKQLINIKQRLISMLSDGHPATDVQAGRLPPSQQRIKAFFKHYRLSDVLPYEVYNPENKLFRNQDAIGFSLDLYPTTGADDETARVIAGIFTQGVPEHTAIQFSMYGSPNVMGKFAKWAEPRDGGEPHDPVFEDSCDSDRHEHRNNNIYKVLARKRVEYLMGGMHTSLMSDQPVLARDFRLVVSVMIPKSAGVSTEDRELQCEQLRESMVASFNAAGLYGHVMTADDFVDLMDDILNPRNGREPKREKCEWNPHHFVRDQVVQPDTQMLVGRDGLTLNDTDVRCFSVRNYPKAWALWAMSDMIGDFFQNILRLPCPFLMTANIYIPDQAAAKQTTKLKAARATQATESPIGKYVPVWADKKVEWDFVNKKVEQGHTLCRMNHQIVLFSPLGQGEYSANLCKSMFKSKGWEVVQDRFVVAQSFLSALPQMLSKRFVEELETMGKLKTQLTWTAANLLPILGEWKGSPSPVLTLLGRRGQVQWVDPYDNDQGNYNIACVAASGAGKSTLVQELALSIRSLGGRTWIIDSGRSYEKLCKQIGGLYLEFKADTNINLNPFTHISDWLDEGLPMLKPLIAQMASPSAPVSDIQASYIEQALKYAWSTYGNDSTITPVAEFLLRHSDERARDLGTQLYSYTKDGMYARYFEGPSNLDFNNNFVVLELGELANKKDLQSVVLLILMMQITQSMYLGDRCQRSMCIIEESWRLMSSGNAGSFVEEGYRVARKHGGSFVTVCQAINDYYKSDTSRAALENADWMFMLRQKKESIEQLEKSDRLNMTPYMKKALKSLKTEHGKYSELMVNGPSGWSIGRLVIDPYSEKLYSTQADEYEAIERMMKRGMTLSESLDRLVQGAAR